MRILFNAHYHIDERGFPSQRCIRMYVYVQKMPLTTVGKWTVLYTVVAVELAALAATWRLWDNLNRRPGSYM